MIIPGVGFHEEMALLRDAGIPAKDVLRKGGGEIYEPRELIGGGLR